MRMRPGIFGAAVMVLFFAGCQTPHAFVAPDAAWKTHNGQLKFTSGKQTLIGEVVVSRRGTKDFQLEFQKGGVPMLRVRLDETTARAEGLLVRWGWQGAPDRAPRRLRSWLALREAFVTQKDIAHFTVAPSDSTDRFEFIFAR